MRPRRALSTAVFLTIVTAVVFVARYGFDDRAWGSKQRKCIEQLGWLEPYNFTYPIQYVSRDIVTSPSPEAVRHPATYLDKPLFADFHTVDLAKSQVISNDNCLAPLLLEVPHGSMQQVDASNMMFGFQTTIGRLRDTVKHLERWLPNTGARLFAIVIENEETPANDNDMATLQKEFQDKRMNVTIIHPLKIDHNFPQRYFSLVNAMYAERNSKTEWITLIDDDTFFPSMFDLRNLLSKYSPSEPHYIGSLSEDWWAVKHYGLMGFGGAGIILSLPLAKILDDHVEECNSHPRTTAGDITVMDCVYRFSTAKLTNIPSLHQVDMHGDLSGFYESGREISSLHHWKEGSAAGYKLEMEKMHLVADICDSCFLQRWVFPHDVVLANGFSITRYPQGSISGHKPGGVLGTGVGPGETVEKIDLQEMEETWKDGIDVLHSLAPLRKKLGEEQKLSYKLLDSMFVDNAGRRISRSNVVRQVYFKEGGEGSMDTLLVLNWGAGMKRRPAVKKPESPRMTVKKLESPRTTVSGRMSR